MRIRAMSVVWMLAGLALASLYVPFVTRLGNSWWTDTYAGHGVFVPFYSAFLLWTDRRRIHAAGARRGPFGSLIVMLGLGVLVFGRRQESLLLEGLSFVLVIGGAVFWARGWECFRRVSFPVVFLVCMLPLPRDLVDAVSIHLQIFVAQLAAVIIGLAGLPCYQNGILIELPGVTLAVAEACNGLRFLLALLTLTAAFAQATQRGFRSKLLLTASALPLAILANAVRVAAIALTAHYMGAAAAVGWTHHLIGKSVWGLALLPLLGLGLLLRRIGAGADEGQPVIEQAETASTSDGPIAATAAAGPYGLEG